MRPRRPLAERFWPKVDRRGPDECWPWLGASVPKGYGHIGEGGRGRMLYSHRVAYALEHGLVPNGLEVCHRCDNPPCCNPAHLFVGTHAENGLDMAMKGRSTIGERNPRAKLTMAIVSEIEFLVANGRTHQSIADQFGVGREAISKIARGERWRHARLVVRDRVAG